MSEHAYRLLGEALEAGRTGELLDRFFFLTVAEDRIEEERRRYHADLAIAELRDDDAAQEEEPT